MKEFLSKALHAERMRFRGRVMPAGITLSFAFSGKSYDHINANAR